MTWPPFHQGARREFDEALDLLATESPAAAVRLVERTQATIPLIYFPGEEDIYVVAFAHERQEPGYWIDRSIED